LEKYRENRKVQFLLPRRSSWFNQIFCDFDNFLFSDLSLRCHETLINLSPHLHELNLVVATITNGRL